ncbi:expressed unknown protein [Ectocarpus siliculosus]|uniref:Uncharacterized protein n=1 Tax=Ectocarpus siliculosus TaxID=2880 RepID=D7G4J9_ECTSI|nr:expressed unknown protein [Ectocarpus siliculosus]|eukprot:CBJ48902.1 expressed unknown protein [Ectocarpus siliculosus]
MRFKKTSAKAGAAATVDGNQALDPKLQKRAEQAPASYELNNDDAASPAGNKPAAADASSSARRAAAAASGDNKGAEREGEVVEGYSEADRGSAGTAGGRPIAEGRVAREETQEGGAGGNTEPPLSPPGSGEQRERVAPRAAAAAAVARGEEGRGRVSEGATSAGGDGRGSAAAIAGDDHAATAAAGGSDEGAGGDADVRTSGPVDSQQSVGAAAQSDGQAKGQTNTAPPAAAIPSKPARTLADVAAFVEADSIAAEKAYTDALTATATAAQSQESSSLLYDGDCAAGDERVMSWRQTPHMAFIECQVAVLVVLVSMILVCWRRHGRMISVLYAPPADVATPCQGAFTQ